jgi:hypothetical protein
MAVYSDSGYITGRDSVLTRPALDLNFAREKRLDSRVLFTRASIATYTDEGGIIRTAVNNAPRFDHDPVTGESLGLLIEESRTNISLVSNSYSSWGFNAVTNPLPTDNTQIAPDGTQTAWQFPVGATGNLQRNYNITAGQTYTFSFFAKRGSAVQMGSGSIGINVDNIYDGVIYNWSTNTLGGGWSKVDYSNGWSRFYRTFTSSTSTLFLQRMDSSYGGGQYIWGAQLEQGSFPTSYIPTSGSTVPRAADLASISGTNFTDFYNASEGTLYASFVPVPVSSLSCVASIASSNTNAFGIYSYNTYQLRNAVSNNSNVLLDVGTVLGGDTNKIAGTMKLNDFAASLNGGTVGTDTDGALQSTPNTTFHIGTFGGANQYTGRIKQLSYYPRRLSDAQLRALTS